MNTKPELFSKEWIEQRNKEEQDNLAKDPSFNKLVPIEDNIVESKDGVKLSIGMTVYGQIRGHGLGPQVIKQIYKRYGRYSLYTVSDKDFGGCDANSVYFNKPSAKEEII